MLPMSSRLAVLWLINTTRIYSGPKLKNVFKILMQKESVFLMREKFIFSGEMIFCLKILTS